MRVAFVTVGVLVSSLVSGVAVAAQPSESALAESLFVEGKKLLVAKRYTEACPKLAESQRLDPGGGTALTLALCYEGEGRFASAWAIYHDVLTMAKKDGRHDRERIAKKHLAALEGRVPTVTLKVDPNTLGVAGLELKLDDVALGRATWDAPFPVDPGKRTFTASAPGRITWTSKVEVQTKPVVVGIPPLEEAPKPAATATAEAPPAAAHTVTGTTPAGDRDTKSPSVVPAVVAFGFGLAGLATAGITGALLIDKKSTLDAHCDAARACDADGLAAVSSVDSLTPINTVAFVVGAVGIVAGTVLFIVTRSSPSKRAAAAFVGGVVF